MANTQGFGLVAEITQQGILSILQGAWVSNQLKKNIPVLPSSIGGIPIHGGQVQVSILDVKMVPASPTPVGSLKLTFDLTIAQVQLQVPSVPSLGIVGFEAHVSSTIPVGSKPGIQDVALLLDDLHLPPADANDVTLIPPDPILANLPGYITDFGFIRVERILFGGAQGF